MDTAHATHETAMDTMQTATAIDPLYEAFIEAKAVAAPNLLGFVGRGAAWAQLPRRLLEVAQRALAGWLDEAIATNRRANPAQRPLPLH